jgi:hypothetical protein
MTISKKLGVFLIILITFLSICLPTFAAEEYILGFDESKNSKAYFNKNGTLTVEGKTKDPSVKNVYIALWDVDDARNIHAYETTINSDGTFKITTEPLKGFVYALQFDLGEGRFEDERMLVYKKLVVASMLAENKTKSAIKKKYQELSPKYQGNPLVDAPKLSAPYKAGKLHPNFIKDGLNMTNFVRYLANMNSNIQLNAEDSMSAQHKAVLLEASFDRNNPHFPPKPRDMSDEFYEIAKPSWENLHFNQYSIANAVVGFMDDPGEHNLQHVGHRTSILSPNLSGVGFGFTSNYSVMHMSSNVKQDTGYLYEYIAWPSTGNFPLSFARGANVWSLELNGDIYASLDKNKIKITVTNQRTKKRSLLSKPVGYSDQGYLFVNPDLITFKPNSSLQYQEGDTLTIQVEGVENISGAPSTIKYDIHLFDLSEITVIIDGKEKRYTQPPIVKDNRTMVPIRDIFEALGATITRDVKTNTIIAKKGNDTVTLKIGSKIAYVNKKQVKLDAAPFIYKGQTTMGPIRFISDALQATVNYDAKIKVIEIKTQ